MDGVDRTAARLSAPARDQMPALGPYCERQFETRGEILYIASEESTEPK